MRRAGLLLLVVLIVILLFYFFPLYWTFITSIKLPVEIFRYPPDFLPNNITSSNYYSPVSTPGVVAQNALGSVPFLISSTVVAVVSSLIGTFLIGAPSAYALVRLTKHSKLFGRLVIFMIIIPEAVLFIPLYLMVSDLNLINTWWALILVYITLTGPFSAWFLAGFFNAVPRSIEEAAQIDGMKAFQIFRYVSIRLVLPGLFASFLLNFINCWNEFLYALVMTYTPFNYSFPPVGAQTAPIFIETFLVVEKSFNWGGLAAVGIFTVIPVIIIGVLVQKYFASGLIHGGVKG